MHFCSAHEQEATKQANETEDELYRYQSNNNGTARYKKLLIVAITMTIRHEMRWESMKVLAAVVDAIRLVHASYELLLRLLRFRLLLSLPLLELLELLLSGSISLACGLSLTLAQRTTLGDSLRKYDNGR